jgi:CSLREA domain-containing protein
VRTWGLVLAVLAAVTAGVGVGGSSAQAATTWTVTTTADSTGGSCLPGNCSLRQAIAAAGDGDTIMLPASSSPYVLTHGLLLVEHAITIDGGGARSTTIAGDGVNPDFSLIDLGTITIEGVTITNGIDASSAGGAGLGVDEGTVDLTDDAIVGNTENGPGSSASFGGGISVASGATLNATRDLIAGNTVSTSGTAEYAFGGGVDNNGTTTIIDSTIAGNTASETTPSSASYGGGVATSGGTLTLENDTIVGNSATGTSGDQAGGNLFTNSSAATQIKNTIVSGGTGALAGNCYTASGPGFSSLGGNIETTSGECGIGSGTGDKQGIDPRLGTFANHGGPTNTVALLPGPGAARHDGLPGARRSAR